VNREETIEAIKVMQAFVDGEAEQEAGGSCRRVAAYMTEPGSQ